MGNGIYSSMIELQILNYVYQTNSIQVFILNGITQEYFTTYKEHYNFIKASSAFTFSITT